MKPFDEGKSVRVSREMSDIDQCRGLRYTNSRAFYGGRAFLPQALASVIVHRAAASVNWRRVVMRRLRAGDRRLGSPAPRSYVWGDSGLYCKRIDRGRAAGYRIVIGRMNQYRREIGYCQAHHLAQRPAHCPAHRQTLFPGPAAQASASSASSASPWYSAEKTQTAEADVVLLLRRTRSATWLRCGAAMCCTRIWASMPTTI